MSNDERIGGLWRCVSCKGTRVHENDCPQAGPRNSRNEIPPPAMRGMEMQNVRAFEWINVVPASDLQQVEAELGRVTKERDFAQGEISAVQEVLAGDPHYTGLPLAKQIDTRLAAAESSLAQALTVLKRVAEKCDDAPLNQEPEAMARYVRQAIAETQPPSNGGTKLDL